MKIIKKILIFFESLLLSPKKKKDVLCVVLNELMFSHVRPIYEQLRKDPRVRVWFCFYSPQRFRKGNLRSFKKQYQLRSVPYRIAKYTPWDLVIYPFHGPYFRKTCRKIYIGHGINSGKIYKIEGSKYGQFSYGDDERIIYDKIFASSHNEKEWAKEFYPDHHPLVKVTGSLIVDELIAAKGKRDEILRSLGLDPRRKTVMSISTWGEYSFAQNLGLEFIKVLPELLQSYNVIISLHPNNFVPMDSPNINWDEVLKGLHAENLFVLKKNEEIQKFLPAADLLLSDHTAGGLYYAFLDRPIVFYKNQNAQFLKDSAVLRLSELAYPFHSLENIREDIEQAFLQYRPGTYQQLNEKNCSYAGYAWGRFEEEIYESLGVEKFSRYKTSKEI